jgi:hypothetical protein
MLFYLQNIIMNLPVEDLNALPQVVVMEPIERALIIVGFPIQNERARIMAEGFNSFEDLRDLNEKDIRAMGEDFARRTQAATRITFGLARIKKTIGLMNWVQDSYRCSEDPDIDTLSVAAIVEANQRATVRKQEMQQYETICKTAMPSKLKDEKSWPVFLTGLGNYLGIIPGVNSVHLKYCCRVNVEPALEEEYADYNSKAIACAPLNGPYYQADNRRVHQMD